MLRNKWELVLRFCGHLFVKADPFWVAQTFAPQTGSQHLKTPDQSYWDEVDNGPKRLVSRNNFNVVEKLVRCVQLRYIATAR